MTSIEPFVHKKVIVLHENDTVVQAARAMRERHVGCVVVSDHGGHVAGIVTDRDLVERVLGGNAGPNSVLREVMTRNPHVVHQDVQISTVIRTMEQHGVRRIPVVQEISKGMQKCIGMITLDDLIAAKVIDSGQLMRVVRAQVYRRFRIPHDVDPAQARKQLESFYSRVAEIAPKLQLTPTGAGELTRLILSNILMRLNHTAAMHFISQLPTLLGQEFMDVPAGPEQGITAKTILAEITSEFELDEPTAAEVLKRFCRILEEETSRAELAHVKAQLPDDIRAFFTLSEERGTRVA